MNEPTRQQYMAKEVTFQEYYGAIVREAGIRFDPESDFVARCAKAIKEDEHLNNIPLATWDNYAIAQRHATAPILKRHGDGWSAAGGVCIAKEAMRQAIEQRTKPSATGSGS